VSLKFVGSQLHADAHVNPLIVASKRRGTPATPVEWQPGVDTYV